MVSPKSGRPNAAGQDEVKFMKLDQMLEASYNITTESKSPGGWWCAGAESRVTYSERNKNTPNLLHSARDFGQRSCQSKSA
jgi:hypothetical protein